MSIPALKLNSGTSIPQLGYGVWQVPDDAVEAAVTAALGYGYRSIDTAAIYRNERGTGEAIATCGLPRRDVFLTTKLWNDDQGYDTTLKAFEASLRKLGTDYVDLYLMHWPKPKEDRYVDTWEAMIELKRDGRARAIGVSNFQIAHLQRLIDETGVVPAVNQVELHPFLQQKPLVAFHQEKGIVTEAWSPLAQGAVDDPAIVAIAGKHRRTPAQVILRWHMQAGHVAIPKSVTPARIQENLAVFDFHLDDDDMKAFAALDQDRRLGPNPDVY